MARFTQEICLVAGCLLVAAAVGLRSWDLGRVPGVNGDEAWYGVQAERLAEGRCFALRTPTGNTINPLFMAPQTALHALGEPSFATLRVPALVSGLLALLLNFWLCRRALGMRMACVTTVIHAVLPINIAYSRFAWDASQSLLVTLPVIYAALLAGHEPERRTRWTVVGALCLLASLLVHPTNIFAAPWWIVMSVWAWADHMQRLSRMPVVRRIVLPLAVLACVVAAWPRLPGAAANLGSADNYTAFVERFGDLFTGATVYEYISGTLIPQSSAELADMPESYFALRVGLTTLGVVIAGLTAFALWHSVRRGRSQFDGWLVAAWAGCVVSFFAFAGPGAIAPHFERYAICLVAPTVVIIGRGLCWWMQPTTRFSIATAPLAIALGGAMLATFKCQYFDEFNQRGGRSHLTFRTAAIEPKAQAMIYIVHGRDPTVPTLIETSEWWLYWPLEYLAYYQRDLKVELRSADDPRPLDQQAFANMEAWIVEFAETEAAWHAEQALAAVAPGSRYKPQKSYIYDASGRKLLVLIRLPAK